jgi:hypothetical protein
MDKAGGVAQHGLSVRPCTTFPQHGDKKERLEELYIYIYNIYIHDYTHVRTRL